MKIIITGAAGFVGSHLAEILVKEHSVVGIDNFNRYYDPRLKEINSDALSKKGVQITRCDLATDDCSPILQGADAIFHLAAPTWNQFNNTIR